jgi:hypothetical protein
MAVRDGLYLPRSSRLIYLGWYPLSNASTSCVIPRCSRNVIRTRANARFSRYPRLPALPDRAIAKAIVAQVSILFHKLYYLYEPVGGTGRGH